MVDLDALYWWFDENRDSIIDGHYGEIVLLKDNSVAGYYSNDETAVSAAITKGFSLGEFLVQQCLTKDEDCAMVL